LYFISLSRFVQNCHITEYEYNWSLGNPNPPPVAVCTEAGEYTGAVLDAVQSDSPQFCQAKCAVTDKCVRFTHGGDEEKNCKLFKSTSKLTNTTGFVSGPPRCGKVPMRGQDYDFGFVTTAVPGDTLPPAEHCGVDSKEITGDPVPNETNDPTGLIGVLLSPEACQDRCKDAELCQYWVFDNEGHCMLKKNKISQTARQNFTSGPKECQGDTGVVAPTPPPYTDDLKERCIQKDKGYKGLNLWNVRPDNYLYNVPSFEYCQQHCFDEEECKFFTYMNDTTNRCSLKYKDNSITTKDAISGPKECKVTTKVIPCFEPNKAYKGSDLYRSYIKKHFEMPGNGTVQKCQELCLKKGPSCVWFIFNAEKRCFLLSSVTGELVNMPNHLSGPPSCDAEDVQEPEIPQPDEKCIEKDVEYSGFNMYRKGSRGSQWGRRASATACQETCRTTKGCRWFNYVRQRCYLKYAKGFKRYNKGLQSGPSSCEDTDPTPQQLRKLCSEAGVEYEGFILWNRQVEGEGGVSRYIQAENLDQCQATCKKTEGCVWFNFDHRTRCSLLSWRGKKIPVPGSVSGPPSCADQNYTQPIIQDPVDCVENDFIRVGHQLLELTTSDSSSCQASCKAQRRKCKRFSFYQGNCTLGKMDGFKQYLAGAQSGPPKCKT